MHRLIAMSHWPLFPDALGGSELSLHYLLRSLVRRGWMVEVVCRASAERSRQPSSTPDGELGYPCYRVAPEDLFECIDARIGEMRPEAALAGVTSESLHLLRHTLARGVTGFYYPTVPEKLRQKVGPLFRLPDGIHVLANSEITMGFLREVHPSEIGIVRPMIAFDEFRIEGTREPKFITFINPMPSKGVSVALDVAARMPDRMFLFVKGLWAQLAVGGPMTHNHFLGGIDRLPNVTLWEPHKDMRKVYSVTNVLLFPSQWDEPAGRVILEAHVNGIPVVASRAGGIPAQLGNGGILIEPRDDVGAFVAALRCLEDKQTYARYSALALENAQRPELQGEFQVDRFVEFVSSRLSSRGPR